MAADAERDARAVSKRVANPCLDWLALRVKGAAHMGVFEGYGELSREVRLVTERSHHARRYAARCTLSSPGCERCAFPSHSGYCDGQPGILSGA
jgi:hypothetical protein